MASHLDVQKPEIPSVLSEFSLNRPLFTMDKEESIALLKSGELVCRCQEHPGTKVMTVDVRISADARA